MSHQQPPPHPDYSYPPQPPSPAPGWERAAAPRRGPARRTVALGAAGGAVVLLGGGIGAALALRNSPASSDTAGSDSGSGGWDPNTLPTAAGNPAGISAADIQSLLDAKNRALKTGDLNLFTAAYADGPVKDQAAALFRNLSKFRFTTAQYQLLGAGSRQFTSGSGASVAIDVAFVHQLERVDVAPVPEWYRLTLTRPAAAAPITITAATGSPSAGGSDKYVYYPAIWDRPEVTVITRPHVVLAADNERDAAILRRVADDAETAIAANLQAWAAGGGAKGTSPGALMVGTSDRDMFYAFYSGKANQRGFEAGLTIPLVTAASMDSLDTMRAIGGARIVLDLTSSYFTQDSGEDVPKTLIRHEGAHGLVFPLMSAAESTIPLWAIEGFADWMAKHDYPDAVARDPNLAAVKAMAAGSLGTGWDGTLPTNAQVYASDPTEMGAGYGLSTLAYAYIHAKAGLSGVCRFLTANYQVLGNGTNGTDDVARALQSALGMDEATFTREWAAFVRAALAA